MEKFYIAEEDSKLRKDYLSYKEQSEQVRLIMKDFLTSHGIESKKYYVNKNTIAVVATNNDKEVFQRQLKKKDKEGLFFFKVNSKVHKDWIKLIESTGLEIPNKPIMWDYFTSFYGRIATRLLDIDGQVYCSMKAEGDFEPKDKLTEIKASEFFKTIEDYNESL
ncbi:hypothetical protein EV204_1084 [Tissierella praeacuta]|uniref:hypothetical protein n=1 Tax=Tissierella praeacuta TaxID=43131 RepID=UPI00104A2367|nr:hypothetical protein [Tissierella praeacuta]TCU69647.1 hypothetical protein EV204_1084 [Tissierella praeacuta]